MTQLKELLGSDLAKFDHLNKYLGIFRALRRWLGLKDPSEIGITFDISQRSAGVLASVFN